MSVRIEDGAILLEGRCGAGDAEELLASLREMRGARVEIGGLERLHLAVLQVLLALRPNLTGRPTAGMLAQDIFLQLISKGDRRPESS